MIGKTILHYEILEKLGQGGMGVVYRARDTRLERDIALKILDRSGKGAPERHQRFLREARAASALNHPAIVTVHDVQSVDETDLIAMEYVDGRPLREVIGKIGLPMKQALDYARQIGEGLSSAHEAGIIHRDLKPGNIMLNSRGRIKLLDFGLAKRVKTPEPSVMLDAPTASVQLTRMGMVVGTIAYMSPEQAAGDEIDVRSDIFSFGVILYEMLTGARPFRGDSTVALLRELYAADPPSLCGLSDEIPAELETLVGKALAKERDNRYQRIDDLLTDLEAIEVHSQVVSRPVSAAPAVAPGLNPSSDLGRGLPWRLRDLALVAVVLIALVGLGFLANNYRHRNESPAAVETTASTPAELYRVGREAMNHSYRQGAVDTAIASFLQAVEQDPEFAPAHAGLADAYVRQYVYSPDEQWLQLARTAADEAVRANSHLAAAHVALGGVLEVRGDLDGAEAAANRALELDPRQVRSQLLIARIRTRQERGEEALQYLERAGEIAPEQWPVQQAFGMYHYERAEYEKAAEAFTRLKQLVPDNPRAYRLLAAAYHMQDRFEDAAAQLQQALEIEPTASVYSNLGTLLFFQGQYRDAVSAFKKAVDLDANYYLHWGNLADGLRMVPGSAEESGEAYSHGIQLVRAWLDDHPDDHEASASMLVYLARRGDAAEALAELEKLAGKSPAGAGVLFKMGLAAEIAGERAAALTYLEAALDQGYSLNELRDEPDLIALRADADYHRMMLKYAE
jgi:eukaryotic-like serine/threonine-protein kinase